MSAKHKATKSERQQCERTCISCRKLKTKSEMLRISKNKQGILYVDRYQKLDGRGCYVCFSKECLNNLQKKKILNRTFKCEVKDDIYAYIFSECIKHISDEI